MGLSDSEKLEIIELVRKEISTLFSGKAVATKDDIKRLMEHTDKRFEDMNKRFEELARLIRLYFAIFGVAVTVLTVIVGLASVLGKPF